MNPRALALGLIMVLAVGAALLGSRFLPRAEAQTPAPPAAQRLLAAPGKVEPWGEEREIGAEVIGVLREMRIEENDKVESGQILAVIENREQAARLASAKADLAQRQAELEKLINGARPEERREARAAVAEADAALLLANQEHDRRVPLTKSGATSVALLDQAKANLDAAHARQAAAKARLDLIEAPPRAEDVTAAKAKVALAEAAIAQAEAALEKTFVRSPLAGVVLRRMRVAGEAVSNQPPTPIAIVGDLSRLRVRAEVDELDVARVAVGQRVAVVADALPGKTFGGTVARVAHRLGPKEVQTGRSREKADNKVLQAMIDLDQGTILPVGLRVDVFFSGGK